MPLQRENYFFSDNVTVSIGSAFVIKPASKDTKLKRSRSFRKLTPVHKEHIDIGDVHLQMSPLWWQPIVSPITGNVTNGSAAGGFRWNASNPLRVYAETLSSSAHCLIPTFND